jgi:ribonuclease R
MSDRQPRVQTNPRIAAIIEEEGLSTEFNADVRAETERWLKDPQLEDPLLCDLEALPFVTIDGPTSTDLDQALFIERAGSGYKVYYALADAAFYAPPGSALFREALKRGATYYLPGCAVPMLPHELSSGITSLNPDVRRRALVFLTELDERGEVITTVVERARIRSRRKMTFGEVQARYDAGAAAGSSDAFHESLELLREVGEKRLALSQLADVVRYRRRELDVKAPSGAAQNLVVVEAVRDRVELYNEQISLLVNREGGRLLYESKDPRLQPVYRVHPAPDPEKLESLRALSRGVAEAKGLPAEEWALDQHEKLSRFVQRLAQNQQHPRVARALERQAILVNMRSALSTEPAAHFGVGAEVYARFSAPMREVVGVFLHKEMLELVGAETHDDNAVDVALREEVVVSANRARDTQRKLNDKVNRAAMDDFFRADLAVPKESRKAHVGTVMGITTSKLHVELDEVGMDVKLYVRDLGRLLGGAWLEVGASGATLQIRGTGTRVCALGDAVEIVALHHDAGQDRWVFSLTVRP